MSSERQLLDEKNPWWGEHAHRYHEVLPYVTNTDTILDIACGTGFGSEILATKTKNLVIGGDIAEDIIRACRQNWTADNLRFEVLDGTSLPYADGYFDKVISFETIEHTTKYRQMLEEFRRVLKPDGIAFISTPNFKVNSPTGKVTNPYHTQEFRYEELKEILMETFPDVQIFGQKYSRHDGKGNRVGKWIDFFFNIIGIRKLPYAIKNGVSQLFTGKSFYPKPGDFTMVADLSAVMTCKTFYCVCRNNPSRLDYNTRI